MQHTSLWVANHIVQSAPQSGNISRQAQLFGILQSKIITLGLIVLVLLYTVLVNVKVYTQHMLKLNNSKAPLLQE